MSSSLGFSVCQNVPNAVRITVSCCCRSRGDYFQLHTPGNMFLALFGLIGYDNGNDDIDDDDDENLMMIANR